MRRRPSVPSTLSALVAGVVALAAATALVAPVGATAAAPVAAGAGEAPLRYVALGDSFSAASGVLPPDPTSPPQCLRSSLNYPHVIAERIGADLTDVTCGGAASPDYFSSQYPGVPPQLDALGRGTDLVTMTIGGNDGGVFIDAILACGRAGLTTLGRGNPCEEENGNRFVRTVRNDTAPALVRALRAVVRRAPNAEVAILGYPWLLPPREGCYPQMPVARGDVPYLRNLQSELNEAVRQAAAASGATYVAVPRASEGHDACQAVGTRWVEPVVAGTNPVVVHPNALGERKMATLTQKRLRLRP
ncbi:SGNH/GDSL hydrolase family protein [Nocardioides sp. CFH 31398]|uniref:SGNH/GDSL hydrolase family protein n=1 Tax=Nocardioides sp. CFH 31398 TaxID=2919579 RepID=UPI001F05A603|nr:SGNH/GDSL hydrolase family protein [Nocardioides sp. CFH 31398]MCH1867893.1 SGNH/GDSL hydrolase family protein [Nocardioides sp. CFH 31398]